VNPHESIPTRQSLLSRLKNWDDQESWREFFDTYWQLIHRVARKAGLREDEAQDVVQETILSVAKKMPTFKYDPAQGSFRGWLFQLTRWRIINQLKKRQNVGQASSLPVQRASVPGEVGVKLEASEPAGKMPAPHLVAFAALEEIPDPAGPTLEKLWDIEWQQHVLTAAIARVKTQVSPGQYQMFDLYVNQKMSVSDVTKALGVNAAQLYLAKHRVSALIKKELKKMEGQ